eukprot:342464-Amphidinium_carterae.2
MGRSGRRSNRGRAEAKHKPQTTASAQNESQAAIERKPKEGEPRGAKGEREKETRLSQTGLSQQNSPRTHRQASQVVPCSSELQVLFLIRRDMGEISEWARLLCRDNALQVVNDTGQRWHMNS